MTAYYNEIDAYAADWLRNLIKEGLIADGEVDTRSIVDVRPDDLSGFEQCHFFAGIGGWSYALRLAGWADDRPVWTGSCPCQPFSSAGRQKGFADERHLWPVWRELIRERRPAKVFGEQVASATEWLRLVRGDLEAMEYAVGAMPIQAASAGADHIRDRYWFVADADLQRSPTGLSGSIAGHEGNSRIPDDSCRENDVGVADRGGWAPGQSPAATTRHGDSVIPASGDVPDAAGEQARPSGQPRERERLEWVVGADGKARRVKPGIRLLAHGVPARVGKLRGFGNAIDPRCAAEFIGAAMSAHPGPEFASHDRSTIGETNG